VCAGGATHAAAASATTAISTSGNFAEITTLDCDFDYRPGREFLFPSADPVLQGYGFVLWKVEPSLVSEPLSYARYQGRHGKLTGASLVRQGVRWFEGVLDDCSPVYAEDASSHAEYAGLDHLAFHGKIVFADTYAAAKTLIGHDVLVLGEGLEPRQRLYTSSRTRYYPLFDGEALKVIGIDMHRYAFAKGVGPFFLEVINARNEVGLIKFNPEYLEVPHGSLPVYPKPRTRDFASGLPKRDVIQANSPILGDTNYQLTISRFTHEADGLAAVYDLEQAGFSARLWPQATTKGVIIYTLQIDGFQTAALAQSLADILARRYGWLSSLDQPLP
jgi:hypothetical protein